MLERRFPGIIIFNVSFPLLETHNGQDIKIIPSLVHSATAPDSQDDTWLQPGPRNQMWSPTWVAGAAGVLESFLSGELSPQLWLEGTQDPGHKPWLEPQVSWGWLTCWPIMLVGSPGCSHLPAV